MQEKQEVDGRREIASRNTGWANAVAHKLTQWNVAPNAISLMSIFFSIVGCSLLLSSVLLGLNRYIAYILFAGCVQCRLLCNLFDGMVAVEGGKRSPNGDLYNDMPDRFADGNPANNQIAGMEARGYDSLFPLDWCLQDA